MPSLVDGDTDDAAYLLAVSAIALDIATARADGGPVEPELSQWLDQLATDLEDDGDLTSSHRLEVHDSESRIDGDEIVDALEDYLVAQGSATTVPNIHRALDQDFDTHANIDDCLPLDPLRWTGNADLDVDTHDAIACGGLDCNDDLDSISPDALDTVGDGTDNNCDGLDGIHADGDSLASIASGGFDCDDGNAAVGPPWQPTYPVGQLAKDDAGNHYGYTGGDVVTDASGAWTVIPGPAGSYERLLSQADGTLHLVGLNAHAVYDNGSWTVLASGPPVANIPFMVVDDTGALHYLRSPSSPIYGTDASGSFVETAIPSNFGAFKLYGLDLNSSDLPVACFLDGNVTLQCVRPGVATVFSGAPFGGITGPNVDSMTIADDDSIYVTMSYSLAVSKIHWPTDAALSQIYAFLSGGIVGTSVGAVGNDAYIVVSGNSTLPLPIVLTNVSGSWETLPVVGAPLAAQCKMLGGAEPSLVCDGTLYLLNPGCAL